MSLSVHVRQQVASSDSSRLSTRFRPGTGATPDLLMPIIAMNAIGMYEWSIKYKEVVKSSRSRSSSPSNGQVLPASATADNKTGSKS